MRPARIKVLRKLHDRLLSLPYLPQSDGVSLEKYAAVLASKITGVFGSIAGGIVSIAAVVVLTAYFILEGKQAFERSLSLLPAETKYRLRPVLIGGELAGITGAMTAIPTAVLISVLIDSFMIQEQPDNAAP